MTHFRNNTDDTDFHGSWIERWFHELCQGYPMICNGGRLICVHLRNLRQMVLLIANGYLLQHYSAVGMCIYIDCTPTRPGPVKRFHTNWPALAKSPVLNR